MSLHYQKFNVTYIYGIIYEYHVTDTSCDHCIHRIGQPKQVFFTLVTFVNEWSSSNLKRTVYKRNALKWHKTNAFFIGCLKCAAYATKKKMAFLHLTNYISGF